MNIAIDSRILVSNYRGGIVVYTKRLVEHIARIDPHNRYHLLFHGLRLAPEQIALTLGDHCRKSIVPLPDRSFPGKRVLWDDLVVPLYCALKRIDIYHLPANHGMTWYPGVKRVITIHDLRSLHISDQSEQQDWGLLEQECRRSDHIITVSEFTRQDVLSTFKLREDKVSCIPLGVDSVFRVAGEQARAGLRERLGLQRPFLLGVGLVPRKNVDRVLQAYARLPQRKDIDLVLVGHTGGSWVHRYRRAIEDLGLQGRVHLTGSVNVEDLVLLYNEALVFVFPSLLEGFGIPLLEAMACGTPVITSNSSALPEVAGDAALLVDPLDVSAISTAMERLAESEERRAELTRLGLARAKTFDWERMAQEILAVYQRL